MTVKKPLIIFYGCNDNHDDNFDDNYDKNDKKFTITVKFE